MIFSAAPRCCKGGWSNAFPWHIRSNCVHKVNKCRLLAWRENTGPWQHGARESTWMTHGCFQKIGVFPPKWMVKIMEKRLLKWMIWEYHHFRKQPHRKAPIIFEATPRNFLEWQGVFSWSKLTATTDFQGMHSKGGSFTWKERWKTSSKH